MVLSATLRTFAEVAEAELPVLSSERKAGLDKFAEEIALRTATTTTSQPPPLNLNFVCTHNSRRSHLAAVAAATAASYHNLFNVATFSSGTTATAFYPTAVAATVPTTARSKPSFITVDYNCRL